MVEDTPDFKWTDRGTTVVDGAILRVGRKSVLGTPAVNYRSRSQAAAHDPRPYAGPSRSLDGCSKNISNLDSEPDERRD
jgi:hypothetical protein